MLQRSIRFAIARREADVAQRRFAAIVESCDDAIVAKDLDTIIEELERRRRAPVRLQRATRPSGSRSAMLVPPERRGEEREILARVLAGERVSHFETERVCKDGTRKEVSLTVSAIRDAHGAVIAISSIARDITEHARSIESLRAAEERFRVAFDEMPIGMMIISLDGRYERVNDAFCRIVGYDQEHLTGLPRERITHPADIPGDAEAVRALIAGEATSHMREKRYLHAAGHAVWAAINLTLIRDGDGPSAALHRAGPGHHRAAQLRAPAAVHGRPRPADRAAEPPQLRARAGRPRRPRRALRRRRARCSCSTSTTSSTSTTRRATAPATSSSSASRRACACACATPTCSRAWAATSSRCCSRAPTRQETRVVAEALLAIVREETMPTLVGEHKRLTVSIGIARFDDGERPDRRRDDGQRGPRDVRRQGGRRQPPRALPHRAARPPEDREPDEVGGADPRRDRQRRLRAARPADRAARRQRAARSTSCCCACATDATRRSHRARSSTSPSASASSARSTAG